VDSRLDGALGAADDVSDFQDGKVLKKMQNKNFTVFNAKAA
jgi:hypothetical protein